MGPLAIWGRGSERKRDVARTRTSSSVGNCSQVNVKHNSGKAKHKDVTETASPYRRTYFRVNKVKFFVENMKRYNNWISIPKGLGIHHREENLYPSKDMKSFWFKKVQTALKRMATNGSHHPLEAEANPWHLSLGQEEGFFSDHLLWRGAASSLPYLMFFSKAVRALTTALKASSLPGAMHLSGWSSTASFR